MRTIVDGTGQTQAETDTAERLYVNSGKLERAFAILRTCEPVARARIQAIIRADRRRRGWGHA